MPNLSRIHTRERRDRGAPRAGGRRQGLSGAFRGTPSTGGPNCPRPVDTVPRNRRNRRRSPRPSHPAATVFGMTRTRVRFSCTECGAQAPKWLGRCNECGSWDTLVEETVGTTAPGSSGSGPADRPVPLGDVDTGAAGAPADRGRGAGPGPRRRPGRRLGHAARRRARDRQEHPAAPGARPHGRGGRAGAARHGRGVEGAGPAPRRAPRRAAPEPADRRRDVAAARAHPRRRARPRRRRGRLDPDRRRSRRARRPRLGEPGPGVRAPARAPGQGPRPRHAARRPRHEGRQRSPARARSSTSSTPCSRSRATATTRCGCCARSSTGSARPTSSGSSRWRRSGLLDVTDPSTLFLADRRTGLPGSVVTAVLEGARPVLVEVQALVTPTRAPMPRRSSQGLDANRLDDAARGARRARRDAGRRRGRLRQRRRRHPRHRGGIRPRGRARRRRARAIGKPVAADLVAVGEVGLGGEVRQAAQTPRRLAEAARLGFRTAIVPASVADTPEHRAGPRRTPCTRRCGAAGLADTGPGARPKPSLALLS